jgi:hypothetical protein
VSANNFFARETVNASFFLCLRDTSLSRFLLYITLHLSILCPLLLSMYMSHMLLIYYTLHLTFYKTRKCSINQDAYKVVSAKTDIFCAVCKMTNFDAKLVHFTRLFFLSFLHMAQKISAVCETLRAHIEHVSLHVKFFS